MTQLPLTSQAESNPYRPDIPDGLRTFDPSLYEYLRELAETLREQHNLTQTGDSTFSWELLTKVDLAARFTTGALGRFYHPQFGIIQARYCRLKSFQSTDQLGAPVGLLLNGEAFSWTVTNDLAKSDSKFVLGLGGWYVAPPEESFGWVIVNGVSIQSLKMNSIQAPAGFQRFTWGLTQSAETEETSPGMAFGSLLGVTTGIMEISPNVWEIPPGLVFVDKLGDSKATISALIQQEIAGLIAAQTLTEGRLDLLEGPLGVSGLTQRITAAELEHESFVHVYDMTIANQLQVNQSLSRRLTALETTSNSETGLSIRVTALENGLNGFQISASARLTQLESTSSGLTSNVNNLNMQYTVVDSQLQAISVILGQLTVASSTLISDLAYDSTAWDASILAPTQNAVRDKIESLIVDIATKLTGSLIDSTDATALTLNSPWSNYGSGFESANYFKSADGEVHLQGAIQATPGSPTTAVVLATLPAGFRPAGSLSFVVHATGLASQIDILANGDVVMQSGSVVFTSLSGINFIPL